MVLKEFPVVRFCGWLVLAQQWPLWLAAGEVAAPAAADAGKLEVFSWWTAGGEVEGLNGLFEIYE